MRVRASTLIEAAPVVELAPTAGVRLQRAALPWEEAAATCRVASPGDSAAMQESKDKEIEIKLEFKGDAELAAVAKLLPSAASIATQYNLYFDDAQEGWRGHGFSVRMRREHAGITLTIKTKRVDCGEFVQHDEWEAPVPAALWDGLVAGMESPARFVSALLAAKSTSLPDGLHGEDLQPLGISVTQRQVHRLDNGLKVELDVTTYPDASVCYEAELEVPAHLDREAAAADLRALFDAAGVAWRVSKVTKQSRFRAALKALQGR